jgi:hypothetical protein
MESKKYTDLLKALCKLYYLLSAIINIAGAILTTPILKIHLFIVLLIYDFNHLSAVWNHLS